MNCLKRVFISLGLCISFLGAGHEVYLDDQTSPIILDAGSLTAFRDPAIFLQGNSSIGITLSEDLICQQWPGSAKEQSMPGEWNLNGNWEFGMNREYERSVHVPGLVMDPSEFAPGRIWYRRSLELPGGDWDNATLNLKGALFSPEVYVNGVLVSKQSGGMAPTFHLLQHDAVEPGATIMLEVSLGSMRDLSESDASYVPRANHWRSNVSSYIWDDVVLDFHRHIRVKRMVPDYHMEDGIVRFSYELEKISNSMATNNYSVQVEIMEKGNSSPLISREVKKTSGTEGEISIHYKGILDPWTPDSPNLYTAVLSIFQEGSLLDQKEINIGIREFSVEGKQFLLNDQPVKLRAGTVVWHRWSRDTTSNGVIYDTTWFIQNVIVPLKERGANTMRFHLGNPPERFITLCDQMGLLVQYEWSFFHGMPASKQSLVEQWAKWLDLAMEHPSVVLIHPYNETTGPELQTAWNALEEILPHYPEIVLKERDVIHVHKYWWGMFENVGLYFDSYKEFPKCIMVDEFGGNYLDGYANPGGYKTLNEAFLRFLGRGHSPEERLYHHTISNSRIAEYWRRIGAAGYSPFCITGSWEDGNHWYLGEIEDGNLKPVWNALTAAWSPVSVSIDLWDRNFYPGQSISFPVHFFNELEGQETLRIQMRIEDNEANILYKEEINRNLNGFSHEVMSYSLTLPERTGNYAIRAELLNPPENVTYPVVSEWEVHVVDIQGDHLSDYLTVGIPDDEDELVTFCKEQGIRHFPATQRKGDVVLTSTRTWEKIAGGDNQTLQLIEETIDDGRSVVMLDCGDRFLGQGYMDPENKLSHIEQRYIVEGSSKNSYPFVKGMALTFEKIAEPESHIHPALDDERLWDHIPKDHTWLWNGYRGGLVVPANEMSISGFSPEAYLEEWVSKGAEKEKILGKGDYFAYDLQGYYAFSTSGNDQQVEKELKDKVKFLVEDAPALKDFINPIAEIKKENLSLAYRSQNGQAEKIDVLVNCGRSLTRNPVIMIDFGEGKGNVIISQLITEGRLSKSNNNYNDLYAPRFDPVASQFVLNMINSVTGLD